MNSIHQSPRAVASENVKDRPRISVLRVFGATETGQKALMHIHGALQYTYIEYSGSLIQEHVDVAIRTLQLSIDHALAVSYRKDPYEGKHRYVAHISLVKGVPFYGYHVGYKFLPQNLHTQSASYDKTGGPAARGCCHEESTAAVRESYAIHCPVDV